MNGITDQEAMNDYVFRLRSRLEAAMKQISSESLEEFLEREGLTRDEVDLYRHQAETTIEADDGLRPQERLVHLAYDEMQARGFPSMVNYLIVNGTRVAGVMVRINYSPN